MGCMDWQKHLAAGQTVARRGSRVGHLRGRFRFSLLSEERKPKDFQHSVRLTKSCNIPSSQECNEVKPVPAVEGCREKRVLYLTGCKCSINSFQMMMLFYLCPCPVCVGSTFLCEWERICCSGMAWKIDVWSHCFIQKRILPFQNNDTLITLPNGQFENGCSFLWLFVFFFPHLSKQVCRHFFK